MQDQDIINEEERHEAATEEPTTLGCPSLVPGAIPSGADGTEPGEPDKAEELKRRGAKIKACNDRMRARLTDILDIAEKVLIMTEHPNGYHPGQYGQDYMILGKAIAEIRRICKRDLSGDFPDYEWMAGMMTSEHFDPNRLAQEIEAKASEKQVDYPTFYTPGCPSLGPGAIPSGADGVKPGESTKNKAVVKSIKWPEGFSVEVEKNGRKIVGVIQECGAYLEDETYPYRFFATVYEGNDIVFSITSCARGLYFQKQILKAAMREAVMLLSHMRRWRANRAAKEGGAK